jgi:putative SOS response-associated peptidase YedK
MCGRFTLATPGQTIAEAFELAAAPELEPRYNIAPTQPVAVVRVGEGRRELSLMHWGLIPSWAKEAGIGARMINARGETVAEKPAFRGPFRSRRCLVIADGFFEWKREGERKQPYYITMRDRRPFAFAGLWDRWAATGAPPVESCTIVTTAPNEVLAPIHDRMPVILPPASHAAWLDPAVRESERLQPLLQPFDASAMLAYPVSPRVNNPRNDDRDLIAPLFSGGRPRSSHPPAA